MHKILFWKIDEAYGCFSNWYPSKFVIDDFEYSNVEQYMMAMKAKLFHDSSRYTRILKTDDPQECKKLGKQVHPFSVDVWNKYKYEIVKSGNRAKFNQNQSLKKILLDTGDAILAEASPYDDIWGIGLDALHAILVPVSDWKGDNLLGKILMELRTEFLKEDNQTKE